MTTAAAWVALGALIVLALLLVAPVGSPLRAKVVRSGSMAPTVRAGDLALLAPAGKATPAIGDVILYRTAGGERVLHRVVGVEDAGVVTKGDANRAADGAPVPLARVEAKYVGRIPFAGGVVAFAQTPWGEAILVAAPCAVFAARAWARRRAGRA